MTNKELGYRKELKKVLGVKRMKRNGYKEYEGTARAVFVWLTLAIRRIFNIEKKKNG